MKQSSLYLSGVFLLTACILSLIAVYNWRINPYWLFDSPAVEGFNEFKPDISLRMQMAKAHRFRKVGATGLILGTSRAAAGLDPAGAALGHSDFYNLAAPGTTVELNYRTLKSASDRGRIAEVIYCVDFFTFNSNYSITDFIYEEFENRFPDSSMAQRLAYGKQTLVDYSRSLLSLRTLEDSLATRKRQSEPPTHAVVHWLSPRGLWERQYPSGRKPGRAFTFTEMSYLTSDWFPEPSRRFSLGWDNPNNPVGVWSDYAATLKLAQTEDIHLTIVVLPVHARLLETLGQAGLWPQFEHWKKMLVTLNESVAAELGNSPLALWDFSVFSARTSQQPMNPDSRSREQVLFYDSAHIHPNFGEIVLQHIRGSQAESPDGSLLAAENVEAWLARQRLLRRRFQAGNDELVAEIARSVADSYEKNPWEIDAL